MELDLLQLALTHLLAAKAGSWALGKKGQQQDFPNQSRLAREFINIQNLHGSESLACTRQRRQKRTSDKCVARCKNESQAGFNRTSKTAPLPFASASTRKQTGIPRAASPAWMLEGHSSASPLMKSLWAQRRHLCKDAVQEQQEPSDPERVSESSQSTSSEDVGTAAPGGLVRWWIPPNLKRPQEGEMIVGWHLDDELPPQQLASSSSTGSTSLTSAFSAAASRLFGSVERDAGGGAPADKTTDASAAPSPDGEVSLQSWRGHTPYFVGGNTVGTTDGGAGSSSTVRVGIGMASGSSSSSAAATAAAALTSAGGALGGLAERAVEVPVRGLRQLNRAVTAGVSDFLASDPGRRLSEQVAAEMSTGALMAPVYLTEELVKARLKSLLRSHACWLATFLAVRVSLATAALHFTKELMRRSVRNRGPRWLRGCVHFICDVMLPTGFFGPLLGVTAGVLQLTGVGLSFLGHRSGSSGSGGAAGEPMGQPALAAALPAVAAAASDAVAATVSATVAATVTPVAAAASALASGVGGVSGRGGSNSVVAISSR